MLSRSTRLVAEMSLIGCLAFGACGKLALLPLYFQEKEYAEDREIDAKVKGALLAEPPLRSVAVETYRRSVELTGTVASPADAARAEELAADVSGVKDVRNRLRVGESR